MRICTLSHQALTIVILIALILSQGSAILAKPTDPVVSNNSVTSTTSILFSDDFSTDKGWTNETSGDFYRDTTNEWLSWHIHRSTDEKYYIPIDPYSGDFRLEARLKATYWANNCNFYFGLAESLTGQYNNPSDPTGLFIDFGWFGGYAERRLIRSKAYYSETSAYEGSRITYNMDEWYRIVFEVTGNNWTVTVYDGTETQVDQTTGVFPKVHDSFNYVVLWNPDNGDWPTGDGLFDDLVVEKPGTLDPGTASAVTDMAGEATLSIGGQEITFLPFDPKMPGLPLPYIKITAQEYSSHVILLWEDTLGDRPPPFYRPVVEFLKIPLTISSHSKPMIPVFEPGYDVYLPFIVRGTTSDLQIEAWSLVSIKTVDEPPDGWDLYGPEIAPNTISEYVGPDATVSGPEFATYMTEHYSDTKSIVFYHYEAVPSIDNAVMDIYETVDDGVIAVELRNKGSEPIDETEAVLIHFVWEMAVIEALDDVAKGASLLSFMLSYITDKSFEHYNENCIPVPDLTGWNRDEARTLFQQMGFEVEEQENYSPTAPQDQVIDQYPGPNNISKCVMPGNTIDIEVSIGPEPTEYELYDAYVTDPRNNTKTVYEPGETIQLGMQGVNHSGEDPLVVSYSWETTGPDGQQITSLSKVGWQKEEPHGWVSYPEIEGTVPVFCGEYTFVGSATFTPDGGSQITLKRRDYFQVGGDQCQINNPPNIPTDPSPADDTANQSLDVGLSWTGGDPDGDDVTYDIYFEANNDLPTDLVSDDQSGTTYDPVTLDLNTHYYWQIVAKDEHGATTEGPVWDFTTGEGSTEPVTMDQVYTADYWEQPKTTFRPGEAIRLALRATNHTTDTIEVTYDWLTSDPNSTKVPILSYSDWNTSMPPGEGTLWFLTRAVPSDGPLGWYTYNAFVNYGSERDTGFSVFSVEGTPISINLLNALTCKSVVDGDPVGVSGIFNTSDDYVYLWTIWEGASGAHTVKWEWYRPSGVPFRSYSDDFNASEDLWTRWTSIPVVDMGNDLGQWSVKIYIDDTEVKTLTFTLETGTQSHTRESPQATDAGYVSTPTLQPMLLPAQGNK